ncbi:MAG TPA: hypothetical protein VFH53_05685 [Phycisphaerae bacterium]|nr:hypothetical protein [Phycisphaerae bacterium]
MRHIDETQHTCAVCGRATAKDPYWYEGRQIRLCDACWDRWGSPHEWWGNRRIIAAVLLMAGLPILLAASPAVGLYLALLALYLRPDLPRPTIPVTPPKAT